MRLHHEGHVKNIQSDQNFSSFLYSLYRVLSIFHYRELNGLKYSQRLSPRSGRQDTSFPLGNFNKVNISMWDTQH